MSTIANDTEPTSADTTERTEPTGTIEPTDVEPTGTATRTPKEEQLWATLTAHPGSTCKELAIAAGVGQSTAAKTLSRWAGDGTATKQTATGPARGGRTPE